MCDKFLLAATAPIFSFIIALYAMVAGEISAASAEELTRKITQVGNLSDIQARSVTRLIKNFGSFIITLTALFSTILSYLSSLLSTENTFSPHSPLYNAALVAAPVLVMLFCVYILASVGAQNLFTNKVLSPFRAIAGRATLGFTYGTLINAMSAVLNLSLLIVFALSFGFGTCRPELGGAGKAMPSQPSSQVAPRTSG